MGTYHRLFRAKNPSGKSQVSESSIIALKGKILRGISEGEARLNPPPRDGSGPGRRRSWSPAPPKKGSGTTGPIARRGRVVPAPAPGGPSTVQKFVEGPLVKAGSGEWAVDFKIGGGGGRIRPSHLLSGQEDQEGCRQINP